MDVPSDNGRVVPKIRVPVPRKRHRTDRTEEEQDALDMQLRSLCKTGWPHQVQEQLLKGADPNCRDDKKFKTPLMLACSTQGHAEEVEMIVQHLLHHGALTCACDKFAWTALHYAARNAQTKAVQILIDCGVPPNVIAKDSHSPASLCAQSHCDSALDTMCILLGAGADINAAAANGWTALMSAVKYGHPNMVRFLLDRGANPRARMSTGYSVLSVAPRNTLYAEPVIGILTSLKNVIWSLLDPPTNDDGIHSALSVAYRTRGLVLRAVGQAYPRASQLADWYPGPSSPDPIGCFEEGAPFGAKVELGAFEDHCLDQHQLQPHANYCWSLIRLRGFNLEDVLKRIVESTDPRLWYWVGRELGPGRISLSETLLHIAARANNTAGVTQLMRLKFNPLLREKKERKMPIQLATDPAIRSSLLRYMASPLTIDVADWYGPYCIDRLRTFVLVARRWRNTGLCMIPKDVVNMILDRIRACEYV